MAVEVRGMGRVTMLGTRFLFLISVITLKSALNIVLVAAVVLVQGYKIHQ